jgi:hypothetical protein
MEKENEKIVSIADVLATSKESVVHYVQGIGNFKLKPLTLEMSGMLRKRAAVGRDADGGMRIDEQELTFLIIDECVIEPKIEKEQFKKLPIGVATKIVNAINEISGIGDSKAVRDF